MEGEQHRYPFGAFALTLPEVHELLDLYSVDEIQERMKAQAFGSELDKALAPYLKSRITSGNLHAHHPEDPAG